MIPAFFMAIGDLLSPDFRSILWRAIGLTLGLFVALMIAVEGVLLALTQFSWPWAEWAVAVGTGLLLFAAFFFLMAPVTAAFAGLYLDGAAAMVERKHYPADRPGVPLPATRALIKGLQFAALALAVNLAVLPMVFFGIGAVMLLIVNAYLLSREYFEMTAMRHMAAEEARDLRRLNAVPVFVSGLVPAALALVPFVNLAVPLFSTSYFTHIFKRAQASSA